VDPKIAEHRGRIVKTTGDGLLVELASVVDALSCAVEVQRGMAERNTEVAEDKRIEFRVGIHQGDVIIEGGDIFGDGVNVAAGPFACGFSTEVVTPHTGRWTDCEPISIMDGSGGRARALLDPHRVP